ncbi:MAG: DUF1801 domain-containing protein [Planctomycetota bacterium]|nr:MAG: DUF1801 domain-containing protein [Planctomycetota bacterium]
MTKSASELIDKQIAKLGDWRGAALARMRKLIREADPEVVEELKWMGTPVWTHGGNLCTGETYKAVVKLTFPTGASLPDPKKLFNSGLEGKTRRAIDIREGETVDASAFKALIRAAVAHNATGGKAARSSAKGAKPKAAAKPKLLSGGNPQIAKGDGDAPVQAYIAAMPGWKREVGARLDALITRSAPKVQKAVKWNSPFYGVEGQGWFLAIHCFAKFVRVGFFKGTSLKPLPPGESKTPETRYFDIREDEKLDEKQFASWIRQAAALPGWSGGR